MNARTGKYRYNYTLSLTSALDGDVWSMPSPGRFTPKEETRYHYVGG
jgi:rRNA maturation protein Nop10